MVNTPRQRRPQRNQEQRSGAKRKPSSRGVGKELRHQKKNSDILRVTAQEQAIVLTYKDWLKCSKRLRQKLEEYVSAPTVPIGKQAQKKVLFQEMSKEINSNIKATQRTMVKLERAGYIKQTRKARPVRNEPPVKKSRIDTIFFYAFLLFVVLILSSILNMQSDSGVPKNIAGYAPMTVLTRSMQRVYPQYSFVVTKVTDPNTLEIGDDITYIKENNTTVTHRIIGINESYMETGARGFETKGVENPRKDEEVVRAENVIGKVVFSNYLIGRGLLFVRENLVLAAVTGIGFIYLLDLLIKHIAIAIKK